MLPQGKYEEYHLLSHSDEAADEPLPVNESAYGADHSPVARVLSPGFWKSLAVSLALMFALGASFALGFWHGTINTATTTGHSPYLNLEYSKPDRLWWNTEYSAEGADDAEMNRLWDSTIPWESGIIAVTNDEAKAMELPDSQPFPWDSKGKKLYIVNAHHLLHCVRNIYISIQQYRTNTSQTINYPHILHCLDSLRVEIMCTADDTLRYVPLNSAHGFRPGDGQQRKCRDWSQVEEFVKSHDPCYRYLRPGDKELSNLERFKFCSSDSEYLPKIRKYFGYDDDWVPEPQEGPRELDW